jgi:hypothetical protein
MDDTLLNYPDLDILQNLLAHVLEQLPKWGLSVAPDKVQANLPFHIWDSLLRTYYLPPKNRNL